MRRRLTGSAEALRAMPSLGSLSDKEIKTLAAAGREVSHPEGSAVVREGDRGVGFHVILEGTADVLVDGQKIASLGPGEYFGEMGLLEDKARMASVVATADLRCLTVLSWSFRPMLDSSPGLGQALLEGMSKRLRAQPS